MLIKQLYKVVERGYSGKKLAAHLAENATNPAELRKILAIFILMDDQQFESYRSLWNTTCKTLGEDLYLLLRIEPQPVKRKGRIKVVDKEAFHSMLLESYRFKWFGQLPVLTVVNRLHSVFDTGYTVRYLYNEVLAGIKEMELTKNND